MKEINLIPKQYFKDKSKSKVRILYVILAAALIAILAYSYISPLLFIKQLQAESEAYNGSMVEYNSIVNEINKLQNEKKTMEKRLAILDEIGRNEIKPTEIIDAIKNVMPQDVAMTSMEYTSEAVTIEAVSKTAVGVSEFMVELTKIERFYDVALSPVVKDGEYYKFTITFNLSPGSDKDAAVKNK